MKKKTRYDISCMHANFHILKYSTDTQIASLHFINECE